MVVALLVLSLAMIVGGLFAVVLGWDIVLSERGWTMVIAGSATAASGAVLLGLTAVIGRLGAVRSELASLHEEISRLGAPAPPPPVMDAVAAVSSALLEGGGTSPPAGAADRAEESQPQLPPFMRPAEGSVGPGARSAPDEPMPSEEAPPAEREDATRAAADDRSGIGLPPDFLRERHEERPAAVDSGPDVSRDHARAEDDLPPFEPEDQADRIRSSVQAPPEPDPSAEPLPSREPPEEREGLESEPAPAPETATTVIGTYNSGENRYVMFSDGSIEAQTPGGVFRFNSLDELKEFIASGGEAGSSLAR